MSVGTTPGTTPDTTPDTTLGTRRGASRHPSGHEAALAALWASGGWCGQLLRAEGGESYQLLFQGRRGGGAGPDFRDAVLQRSDGSRVRGDVELHLRSRDWQAHGHAVDPRYNGVVLHVVLAASARESPLSRLANGELIPVVVLRPPEPHCNRVASWPCATLLERTASKEVRELLRAAGRARFTARTEGFARELDVADADEDAATQWTQADVVFFVALAEALGYGRDRAALREAGMRLARGESPDTLLAEAEEGMAAQESDPTQPWQRVERLRLRGLVVLHARWRSRGPWRDLREVLLGGDPKPAGRALLARLLVNGGCVSPGRARILLANVVLPFAAAVATLTHDPTLQRQAVAIYDALPGLPSNQITREMCRQLGMQRLPSGAAAQQGLHHIWTIWCRDKRCETCPCAGDT